MSAAISARMSGRQRRPGRRLEDDRVARRKGRADLPAGHHDRVVPRRDRGDDPDRLTPDHRGQAGRVLVDRLALHHPSCPGEEAQVVDDDRDLVDRGADRLAGILRFEATELVGTGLDTVGELEEHAAPLGRSRVLPGFEGRRGGVGGAVDVLGVRGLDLGDDLAVGRVLDIERLARRRIDPFATDELLIGLDALEDVGHRLVPPVGRHERVWMPSHRTASGNRVPVSGPPRRRRIRREEPGCDRGRYGEGLRAACRRTGRSRSP